MPIDEDKSGGGGGGVEVIRKCDTVDDARINKALNDAGSLGEKLSKLLLSDSDSFEPEKAGLLVDWLSAVELEIVNFKNEDNERNVQVRFF